MADPKVARSDGRPAAPETSALAALSVPRKLTQLGMVAERLFRSFWPLWTVLALSLAVFVFLGPLGLPLEVIWAIAAVSLVGCVFSTIWGARRFRWPSRREAETRLDQTLPGRPIETLSDAQAIGAGDSESQAVWNAHLKRIAAGAADAKAVSPDLQLAPRDPYALRYVAACALAVALLFGGIGQVRELGRDVAPGGQALATGPAWEGWINPPAYTGKPGLYLNEISQTNLEIPEGSRITLRLYDGEGRIRITETVSDAPVAEGSDAPAQEYTAARSGSLTIGSDTPRAFDLFVTPDAPPAITVDGPVSRSAMGEMELPFVATDDYAVAGGYATISLDLPEVERSYGLSRDPEPREDVVVNIPMALSGDRSSFREVLVDNFSEHPWANLPVALTFTAEDDLRQTGSSEPFLCSGN